MGSTRSVVFVAVLVLTGCAHTAAHPTSGNVHAATHPTSGDVRAGALTPKQQLKACHALLDAKKLDEAGRCLSPLESGADDKIALWAAYDHATVLLYQGDFQRAAQSFAAVIAREHAGRRFDNEAMGYNAMTWLRWAEHDLDGAIAENERVKQTVEAAPNLSDDDKRDVLLHYWWDRAYLFLDDAERKSGAARRAAAETADEAQKSYVRLAPMPREHDGVAVLAAYFAYRRHDAAAARRAAQTVDPAKDQDLQDLYVLWLAYDAAGDRAAAADIRKRIETGYEYPMKVVILRELGAAANQAPVPTTR